MSKTPNNSRLNTDPYPSHTYTSVGLFDVCLVISTDNDCSDTLCMTIDVTLKATTTINILNPNTGLTVEESQEILQTSVYPNPTNGNFTVVFSNAIEESCSIQIIDVTGKIVYSELSETSSNNLEFTLSNINSGIYFLVLNGETISKIIVE